MSFIDALFPFTLLLKVILGLILGLLGVVGLYFLPGWQLKITSFVVVVILIAVIWFIPM